MRPSHLLDAAGTVETKASDSDAHAQAIKALSASGATLHELDYEDVALTSAGLSLVRRAAASVLRRFGAETGELPLARALALFLDHVFWEERTGGLILCADFPGQSFCLPIPKDCWGLRTRFGRMQ